MEPDGKPIYRLGLFAAFGGEAFLRPKPNKAVIAVVDRKSLMAVGVSFRSGELERSD